VTELSSSFTALQCCLCAAPETAIAAIFNNPQEDTQPSFGTNEASVIRGIQFATESPQKEGAGERIWT
jgi:hypothetical protein